MGSNARISSNPGIAHAAVAKPNGIVHVVHRVPEPTLRFLVVLCVRLGQCLGGGVRRGSEMAHRRGRMWG